MYVRPVDQANPNCSFTRLVVRNMRMRTRSRLLTVMLLAWTVAGEEQGSRREAKQLNDQEEKYDFQLSFPVDSDEERNQHKYCSMH